MSTEDKETKKESTGTAPASEKEETDQPDEKPRRGAKRRIIDETLLDEEEAQRLAARRAYNRQCAAKARKRSKDLTSTLQEQVENLSKEKAALERTNEVMQAQLQLLEQQNRTLMMNQRGPSMIPGMQGMGGVPGQMLGGMQGSGQQGGGFPSFLESLSAQGRFASLQGDSQQGGGGGMAPSLPRNPAASGAGGVDPNKYYLG